MLSHSRRCRGRSTLYCIKKNKKKKRLREREREREPFAPSHRARNSSAKCWQMCSAIKPSDLHRHFIGTKQTYKIANFSMTFKEHVEMRLKSKAKKRRYEMYLSFMLFDWRVWILKRNQFHYNCSILWQEILSGFLETIILASFSIFQWILCVSRVHVLRLWSTKINYHRKFLIFLVI